MPGSTLRYGSSFCMTTRSPRAVNNWPRLEAVSPLPREEATPPVTKTCLVARVCTEYHGNTVRRLADAQPADAPGMGTCALLAEP